MSATNSKNYKYPVETSSSEPASFVSEFQAEYKTATKEPFALLIQLTRMIRSKSFPLNPDDFLTKNKGQIAGLGGGNLKKILSEHGITQTLAAIIAEVETDPSLRIEFEAR